MAGRGGCPLAQGGHDPGGAWWCHLWLRPSSACSCWHGNPNAETPAQEVEEKGTEKTAEDLQAQFRAKARLVGAVVIGDFFHNLCDASSLAQPSKVVELPFGWSVAAGTILHELPQEVADFVVLTGPEVNFGTLKAGTLLYLYPTENSHGP